MKYWKSYVLKHRIGGLYLTIFSHLRSTVEPKLLIMC